MLIGRTLRQRYKINQYIDRGGFGDTYLAIDLDFPGQPQCVVKHLSPNNRDPKALAIAQRLFKTEAESLSILGEYDQIPRLYSYFEEDGQFYLIQEFIKGHNLTQEFQPGKKWSEAETVEFLLELLEILTVVHQHNTIHRDLKPANIMRRDSDSKLVLIDFGAVKEVVTVDQKGQTNSTVAIGTSSYMSPEQAKGKPGKYSDVYAVGMLGIQALTGLKSEELPEDSESLQKMWQNLDIKVSSELKSALNKMVSLQYRERYQDAVEARKPLIPTTEIITYPQRRGIISQLKIKLLLILLGAISIAALGIYVRFLSSKVNYDQLEEYLKNGQWQQADAETDRIILQIAGEDSSLDLQSIKKLPCESLQKIDELWVENSNGNFGLTPQKKIYLDTGNQIGQYRESTYEEFGNQVKWRTFGAWSLYGDLKFTDIAPLGHLPSPGKISPNRNDLRLKERGMLLSRVDACGL
ncbi:MAG: GUN4 domain-containing protein [Xenococcus sp. (in: cyanobacteria)]